MIVDFSEALQKLINGYKIARKGWNGKGMYAYYITDNFSCIPKEHQAGVPVTRNTFGLLAADGSFGPWVPSTSDLLANDWGVV